MGSISGEQFSSSTTPQTLFSTTLFSPPLSGHTLRTAAAPLECDASLFKHARRIICLDDRFLLRSVPTVLFVQPASASSAAPLSRQSSTASSTSVRLGTALGLV